METALGFLITGGEGNTKSKLVSVINPRSETSCELTDLPDGRKLHTQCGPLLCGGSGEAVEKSCLLWDGQSFTRADITMEKERKGHLCWSVDDKVILMGGEMFGKSSEIFENDGTSSTPSFQLVHPVR